MRCTTEYFPITFEFPHKAEARSAVVPTRQNLIGGIFSCVHTAINRGHNPWSNGDDRSYRVEEDLGCMHKFNSP